MKLTVGDIKKLIVKVPDDAEFGVADEDGWNVGIRVFFGMGDNDPMLISDSHDSFAVHYEGRRAS